MSWTNHNKSSNSDQRRQEEGQRHPIQWREENNKSEASTTAADNIDGTAAQLSFSASEGDDKRNVDDDDDKKAGEGSISERGEEMPGQQSSSPCVSQETAPMGNNKNTHASDSSLSQEDNKGKPLLSILNVVVDHVMLPPSPMEPDEFALVSSSSCKRRILVPVMRIFGPISQSRNDEQQRQSACLHIHGAFPYLLARPVLAGPDASSAPSSSSSCGAYMNWDNCQSVALMTDVLQVQLESTLAALERSFSLAGHQRDKNDDQDKKNDKNQQSSLQQPPQRDAPRQTYIRRVSVVSGRGFYGYCPGPPAPFVRVEYYDPKTRWKIKLALERGIDLPQYHHPDPRQYGGATRQDADTTNQEQEVAPLPFRCFEAHIPYTMQLFKDCNLAGMSHVHVADARFRTPLPRAVRLRTRLPNRQRGADSPLFLESTVPSHLRWNSALESKRTSGPKRNEPETAHHSPQAGAEKPPTGQPQPQPQAPPLWNPPSKDTLCDVELDTTVDCLLNMETVMTSVPLDRNEKESIHWRAVPSLREIWMQERQRMTSLLGSCKLMEENEKEAPPPGPASLTPESDATTTKGKTVEKDATPKTPPFTLSVKRGASVSGTRQAVRGVKQLFQTSHGLLEEYRRALGSIVRRHQASLEAMDKGVQESFQKANLGRNRDEEEETVDIGQDEEEEDEALEALRALGGQFLSSTPVEDNLTESGYSPHSTPREEWQAQEEFGRSVERGDVLLMDGTNKSADDLMDAETLTPYEEDPFDVLAQEECMEEAALEKSLTILATQGFAQDASDGDDHTQQRARSNGLATTEDTMMIASDHSSDNDRFQETSDSPPPPTTKAKPKAARQTTWSTTVPSPPLDTGDTIPPGDVLLLELQQAPPPSQSSSLAPWKFSRKRRTLCEEYATTHPSSRLFGNQECVWLEPVPVPPTSLVVQRWAAKRKRPKDEAVTFHPKKKKKKKKTHREQVKLRMDDNALKMVAETETLAEPAAKPKKVEFNDTVCVSSFRVVEEVQWKGESQPDPSQSQSQGEVGSPLEKGDLMLAQSHEEEEEEELDSKPLDPEPTHTGESQVGSSDSAMPSTTWSEEDSEQQTRSDPLQGLGQQGSKLHFEGGGAMKATAVRPDDALLSQTATPLFLMSLEIHVQCRTGKAGANDSKEIAMRPDSSRDAVMAVAYVYAVDPGGGESVRMLERGCLYVPVETDATPRSTRMGLAANVTAERVKTERHLLLRLSSIVQWKDPDALLSWDTQGAGIGYLIERGAALGKDAGRDAAPPPQPIDMVRLLGRTPRCFSEGESSVLSAAPATATVSGPAQASALGPKESAKSTEQPEWKGSGLGAEWDDRVGAGAAAASIVGRIVLAGWKIISEEVKHPNASYQPAMAATILRKRLPFHDDILLTRWYGRDHGRERWRVLQYRILQSETTLLMLDALDVMGRAGEAARLSGVEFSQSLPGIRGSQYKVEGVLLRALQSVLADERGEKVGRNKERGTPTSPPLISSKSPTQSPWKLHRNANQWTNQTKEQPQGKPQVSPAMKERPSRRDRVVQDRGYFFYSPSKDDCARQEALECQALTLEPVSGFHFDPVVVCDFTALYPSLVIAYNLCYSTIAGRLEYHSTRKEMRRAGCTTGNVGPLKFPESRTAAVIRHHMKSMLSMGDGGDGGESFNDRAYVIPTGALFVGESVLKGVLPQVLDELLSTRAMLKKAAKQYKKKVPDLSPSILRQLEARQLALKYVANVTYGYTSATFSGRSAMPLLADAIVDCARRTLTNAMNLANSWGEDKDGRWYGAKVLYGDTDSVFVRLPGRSVAEAFRFGNEFCKAVTASNPPPVQLKLEKVYKPALLQTKKRYCGMKYDSPDQKKPDFEAKGIETIRRDQCALTQKVLKNALVMVFQHGINAVKEYLHRQWAMIHGGRLPVSDFILTGRVRSRYRGGRIGPVQAALARRLAEADPGRAIRHGERLPYVIVATPGVTFRLRDCVLTPTELLEQWDSFTVHSVYYATKHVNAALQRCLGLAPFKVDVNAWYEFAPKPRKRIHYWPVTKVGGSAMISTYFGSDICGLCGSRCKAGGKAKAVVCSDCRTDNMAASAAAMKRLQEVQRQAADISQICQRCNGCHESAATFAVERVETRPSETPKAASANGGKNTSLSWFDPARFDRQKSLSRTGVYTPLANCTCIDCPVTFERHKFREAEIEAKEVCRALDLF